MNISNIVKLIDKLAPFNIQEDWDNSGFLIGDINKKAENILISLDISTEVIKEAKENKIDLILTHHPIIISSIKSIRYDDFKGKMIIDLIKNDIAVLSSHTNLDKYRYGAADDIAKKINLIDLNFLDKEDDCDFGIGVFGTLEEEKSLKEISNNLKTKLKINNLQVVGDLNKKHKNISIVNGSGLSYLSLVKNSNSSLFISSDIKYHDAMDAKEMGISLIDLAHYESEKFFIDFFYQYLKDELKETNLNIMKSRVESNPIKFY